ncbi:hypothetical protein [Candidatus Methylomirabilis sp.]|uniref:hypothetical protein n=1 Tax=Candidatus Methylomirabilis sp. TaxID=2032687 RepID=UPI002A656471|nr:hypothetical protein [Candidatus Methylomirabilis sp.]
MVQNRMVAVCDILGFSDMVNTHPLQEVIDNSLGYLSKAIYHSMKQEEFPNSAPILDQFQNQRQIGFAWFSDTVLLYAFDDEDHTNENLVETAAWLLFETMVWDWSRLRVGVAYGEFLADEKAGIYVGKAMIDAYRLQCNQDWSGGALTPSAANRLGVSHLSPEQTLHFLVNYPVPLKSEPISPLSVAVDWTFGLHDFLPMPWSSQSPEPSAGELQRQPSVVRKWRNTKKFHETVCKSCHREGMRSENAK